MLCALVFPSRGRPALARRMVQSAIDSADGTDFIAMIRIDNNDPDSGAYTREFESISERVVIVCGNRERGWLSGSKFCGQLAEMVPTAKWVWFLNDDMMILGKGWDTQLADIPTTGFIVQPEYHKLKNSVYPRDETSCAPITPNLIWKELGYEFPPCPVDAILPDLLRKKGWTTRFLEGITIFHDWNK